MAEAALLHRLYTNAAAGQSQTIGARAIPLEQRDAAAVVSPDVLAGLDELLRKTQPAGNETAWVVRRFAAAGGDSYACVVASYPDLVHDAKGRAGFLNHARLVRVTEPSFDVAALVELAESFPIQEICATPEEERLAAYVNLIGAEENVTVREVAVAELKQIPRAFLEEFLTACFAGVGQSQRMRFALPEPSIDKLALAWSAMPLALQRKSSWAVGTDDGCSLDAIFDAQGKAPARVASKALVECVQRYAKLLDTAPQELSAMLRNPKLATVVALDEVVKRATVAAPLSQEIEMQTKKSRPQRESRRDEWDPLDADSVAELKRQYDAMEESLKHYVDQRIAALERQSSRGDASSLATFGAWVPALVVLAITLGLLSWLFFTTRRNVRQPAVLQHQQTAASNENDIDEQPSTATQPERAEPTAAQRAVAAATANGKWADALRDYLATDAEAAGRAIADAAATAPSSRATLDDFASRVSRGIDLKSEGRERLRALLIDTIAAQSDNGVVVDGKLTDVDMTRLKKQFGVTATKPIDAQSEIILRWMAGEGR